MCGEKLSAQVSRENAKGSPPRVRGKVGRHVSTRTLHRITPACAGKSFCSGGLQFLVQDHPRVCGEKEPLPFVAARIGGSPPRVRGKDSSLPALSDEWRITPACAGKRPTQYTPHERVQDHPRVCGEKLRVLISANNRGGSPPRVRGKVQLSNIALSRRRITPACAGKRAAGRQKPCATGDHPRVCGEKYGGMMYAVHCLGSPPRVRGKGIGSYDAAVGSRITPACAGKSLRNHPAEPKG